MKNSVDAAAECTIMNTMSGGETAPKGKIAGIDYGTVRIGIAVSDPDRILASPCETYVRQSPEKDAAYFRRFADEERISLFVIGLPLHLSGDVSEKAEEVLRFGKWLKNVTGKEIDYYDERYTSVEAERLLREAKLTNKKRKERRDKLAAQILLSGYLENGCRGTVQFLGIG
ncbi:MAG: Holliday junction resolvase RuvX [Planctomycetaceae bacterium]|jgi:putative Holliday junction resolvase|nr:Holliday junction resolvase RuvX [Planctomycetaceae bacterium]